MLMTMSTHEKILHTIWQALTSLALVMAPEDVYNMDDTRA